MSGLYTRTLYDESNNRDSVNISTASGVWIANTPQQSDTMCYSNNGPRNTRNSSVLPIEYQNAIDIESALKCIDVPLTRSMNNNTLAERDKTLNKLQGDAKKRNAGQNCSNFLDNNHTRLGDPAYITEKSYDRYGYPIIDPREWTFYGFTEKQFTSSTEGNVRDGRSTRYDTKTTLDQKNRELRLNAGKSNAIGAINA